MSESGLVRLQLGEGALRFVREQLAFSIESFDVPLARFLLDLDLAEPFALLNPGVELRAQNWEWGGVDDGSSDRALAESVDVWLRTPDPGHVRGLVLEEPLSRYSDPPTDRSVLHLEEQIYYSATSTAGMDAIAEALHQLYEYPGIGVLTRPPTGIELGSGEISEQDVQSISQSAVAVLVRAWDGEAYVVAPVGERLVPHDFFAAEGQESSQA